MDAGLARSAISLKLQTLAALRDAGASRDKAPSFRRLARSLVQSAKSPEFDSLAGYAERVATAGDLEIGQRVDDLLGASRAVLESSEPTREVLVVEDDPCTTFLLQAILDGGDRRMIATQSPREAEQLMRERPISLVILDLAFGASDGRDFLDRLKSNPDSRDVPVIVVSSNGALLTKTECFALGADAYIEKPFDLELLSAVVSSKISSHAVTQEAVHKDALTGALSRAGLVATFERMSRARGRGEDLSLALIDLDRFKWVNDNFGHLFGDSVLFELSRVLCSVFRDSDCVARWGGEEFVVLLRASDFAATISTRRALQAVRNTRFGERERLLRLSFSAGVVAVRWNESLDSAVSRADVVLYSAKQAGRNRVLAEDAPALAAKPKVLVVPFAQPMLGLSSDPELNAMAEIHGGPIGEAPAVVIVFVESEVDVEKLIDRTRFEHPGAAIVAVIDEPTPRRISEVLAAEVEDFVSLERAAVELTPRIQKLLRRR